jgi:hypothetical protein
MHRTPTLRAAAGAAALALLAAAPLASPTAAQERALDRLSIHGHLSQAYAIADSLQMLGIPSDGTADYRRAALLLRYELSAKESFVVQLGHRRLGEAAAMTLEENVKLDWGFYERSFGDATSVRVGRAPLPVGLLNEVRYVGTVLPFFRAPYAFYLEGMFTNETIDGVVLAHALFPESAWRVDAEVYGGSFSFVEGQPTGDSPDEGPTYEVGEASAKSVLGAQAWLSLPIEGVRIGGGGLRMSNSGGILRDRGETRTATDWHAGVEGRFERATFRGEYRELDEPNLRYIGWYAQGSVRVAGPLWLHAQGEEVDVLLRRTGLGRMDADFHRDRAVGASWVARSNLVLKAELHQTRGMSSEEWTAFPLRGVDRYAITSLSVSF